MISNDDAIDESKNYIRTPAGIIGPLTADEIISYIEQGAVQDTDEIYLPREKKWQELKDLPDLYELKPEKEKEIEYPELIEAQYIIGNRDKRPDSGIFENKKLKKIIRYRRLEISLPIRYRKRRTYYPEEREYKKSSIEDLSFSGFSFRMYGSAVVRDTILECEINLPGFPIPFMCVAKVVRVSKTFQDQNIIGMRFMEVNEGTKRMLVRFLREEVVRRSLKAGKF